MQHLHRRNSSRLSHTRWLAYATASLATAFAATAEAEIQYSGLINEVFDGEGFTRDVFPLTDGASLSFAQFGSGHHFYDAAYFGVLGGAVSNGFRGTPARPERLDVGENVAAGNFVAAASHVTGTLASIYGSGNFTERGSGFIGFKFNTGSGTQYGWARVKVSGAPENRFTVIDYAWADSGERIKTGQKGRSRGMTESVARFPSLGMLAAGAPPRDR